MEKYKFNLPPVYSNDNPTASLIDGKEGVAYKFDINESGDIIHYYTGPAQPDGSRPTAEVDLRVCVDKLYLSRICYAHASGLIKIVKDTGIPTEEINDLLKIESDNFSAIAGLYKERARRKDKP